MGPSHIITSIAARLNWAGQNAVQKLGLCNVQGIGQQFAEAITTVSAKTVISNHTFDSDINDQSCSCCIMQVAVVLLLNVIQVDPT